MNKQLTHVIAITEYDEAEKYSCRVLINRATAEESKERVQEAINEAEWDFLYMTGDYAIQHLVSFDPAVEELPDEASEFWNIYRVN